MAHLQESLDPVNSDSGQARLPMAVLAAVFAAAFVFACFTLLALGHFGLNVPRSLWPFGSGAVTLSSPNKSEPDFVPFSVSRSGSYLKAQVGESANPLSGQDYVFFLWFRLRKLPASGETLGIVGKFDSELPGKPGYAISLEGAPDGVRPRVYLSTGSNRGEVNSRWYSFSSYPMNRRDWYLLTVSIVDDKFVTTYLGRAFSSEAPLLLGGHQIEGSSVEGVGSLPQSKADVVVGAFGSSRFRGQIGSYGILAGKQLSKKLPGYLAAIQAQPSVFPVDVPKEFVLLWGAPSEDLGPHRFGIVSVTVESKKNADAARQDLARPIKSPKKTHSAVTKKSTNRKAKSGVRGK
jgi:hypothetical protein